jgi:bacteriocin-like protein
MNKLTETLGLTDDELAAVSGGMIAPPAPPKPIEIVLGSIVISIGPGGITIRPSH